jgi:hypothetical protein
MPRITIDNIKDWPPERFEAALREAIESTSPVDALIATTRRLKEYEQKYSMTTEEFYARFMSGELGDAKDFIGWAGMFEAFTRLKRRLEVALMSVAVQQVTSSPTEAELTPA